MEEASDKELEQRLEEAGNELLNPPSSVDELRTLLDRVHDCLSKVEQSPPISMRNAFSALQKALVADNLLKHSDEDLKVAVAASISEITRITAPDAPYEDEQMKAVFQLIVSSFESLADMSNRSYAKRTSILETVAKVRSCVVMLDLECDALITEMFRHFLKAIRECHPENIFSSMETIMTLVIEESEDISPELLSTLLDHTKKDNKEILPISCKLAEGVLQTCASKLKPYLIETVKSSGISVDNYSNVVSSICQGISDTKEQNEIDSNKLEKEKPTEVVTPQKADVPNEGPVKTVVSNGVAQTGESRSMADSDSSKKQDGGGNSDAPKKSGKLSEADHVETANGKEGDTGGRKKRTIGKRKKTTTAKRTKSSKSSKGDEMESKTLAESITGGKDLLSSPQDDPSASAAGASENEMEVGDGVLPNEPDSVNVASPSGRQKIPDELRPEKAEDQDKKDSLPKEAETATNNSAIVASKAPNDSEAKTTKKSGKKVASSISNKKKRTVGSTKKGSSVASKSKAKPLKSEKEDEDSDVMEESSKQEEQEDREGRAKANSDRDELGTSSKDNDKELVSSPKSATKSGKDDQHMEETPKENSKRKRSLGKEKASGSKECGENLVGSRIKVYWPMDRSYYVGVVDSYDAAKKRHLVLYDDGDQEILYLKNQKWEFIQDDPESSEKEAAEKKAHPEPQKKKAKTGSGAKLGKTTVSAKKAGGASTSKSKPSVTKSGKSGTKSKEASKAPAKMETDSDDAATDDDDQSLKSVSKAATTKSGGASKVSKSSAASKASKPGGASKASGKSKEEPLISLKSAKPASTSASKTKAGKPNVSQSGGKSKSSAPSKAEESSEDTERSAEDAPEHSDAPKSPEASTKAKPGGSAKGKGAKRGKQKRKR